MIEPVTYNLDYYDGGKYVKKISKNAAIYDSYQGRFKQDMKAPNVEEFTKWYSEYFEKNFDGSDVCFDSLVLEDGV